MRLRKLKTIDAELMLEWMHDDSVVHDLQADFINKTIEDCRRFIDDAQKDDENVHLAIVDDNDKYMGTVSLKNINNHNAEFGIAVRTEAMGKGYSRFAMREIIRYGFSVLGLNMVFWCVSPNNTRAIRFYEKNGYKRVDANALDVNLEYSVEQVKSYIWYGVRRGVQL